MNERYFARSGCDDHRLGVSSIRITLAVAASLALTHFAAPGFAAEAGADGAGQALTVFVSRGWAVAINGSYEIDMRSVGARWSHRWRPAGKGWLHGNPTLSVEVIPYMDFDQDPREWAPALNLVYEQRLSPTAKLHPVLKAGAGILYASGEVPPGETRLNFSLLLGLGLDIDLSRRWQLAPEYRFHHVSNANTGPINPGINAHTLVVGLTLKLR